MDIPPILGRLVRSSAFGFDFCCQNTVLPNVQLGALVRTDVNDEFQTFAIVCNLGWDGDGLSEQLAVTEDLDNSLLDEDIQRNGGPIITARFAGFKAKGHFHHCLPPRPPSALTCIHMCDANEWADFTSDQQYVRLLIESRDNFPFIDVMAHHATIADGIHIKAGRAEWMRSFIRTIVRMAGGDTLLIQNLIYSISNMSV